MNQSLRRASLPAATWRHWQPCSSLHVASTKQSGGCPRPHRIRCTPSMRRARSPAPSPALRPRVPAARRAVQATAIKSKRFTRWICGRGPTPTSSRRPASRTRTFSRCSPRREATVAGGVKNFGLSQGKTDPAQDRSARRNPHAGRRGRHLARGGGGEDGRRQGGPDPGSDRLPAEPGQGPEAEASPEARR